VSQDQEVTTSLSTSVFESELNDAVGVKQTLIESLGGEEGVRERLFPKPGDRLYFPLADLLLAMKKVATSDSLTILDYGAGLAPYSSLFPNSRYRRADIEAFADPDYIISPDGRVSEKSKTFDVILSSQVLEHVSEPAIYLLKIDILWLQHL
jgi:hypothetical protein